MNPTITIESVNGQFRAQCSYSDDADEMTVTILEQTRFDGGVAWAQIHKEVFSSVPYHVLRDRVHDLVNRLEGRSAEALTRHRVRSVNGVAK